MKNKSYIGISFIILIFGIFAIPKIVNKVKDGEIVGSNRTMNFGEREKSDLVEFSQAPSFSFLNEEGKTVDNKFYENKVYLVEFFFTTCPTICPIMNQNMSRINDVFGNRRDFGIVSITINPEHDTQEVLKKYKQQLGVTNKNWNFLTGDHDVIYSLADQFKVYANKNEAVVGGFEHSGLFALIDKDGFIRSRKDQYDNPILYYRGVKEGESADQVNELIRDIEKLLKE